MRNVIELRQQRAGLIAQARDLVNRAEAANRNMDAEEERQYDKIMNDVDGLQKKIEQEERLQSLENNLDSPLNQPNRPTLGGQPGAITSPRETEEYQNAFNRFLRSGISSLTSQEFSNMQSTKDTEGGFLVAPAQFVADLLKKVDDMVLIRQWATVQQLTSAESLGRPTLDSDPADADWTSELKTGNETDMTFGKRELRPHPLAKRIKVSNKLIRVSTIGIEQLVRDRLAYKFGVTQEKAYLTGDGVNKPLGLFTASTDGISTGRDVATGNTATAIKFDGLIEAKYTLKGAYWNKAKWLFHRDAVKQLAKEKDANNNYIWKESVRVGEPDTVLGLPVYMSEFAPNTFTTGKYVGMLGDFSFYHIVDALDLNIQRLVELYAETNQTGFIGRYEGDGMPALEEAFVRVKLS
jgi:HK97 family phage major capsid protein